MGATSTRPSPHPLVIEGGESAKLGRKRAARTKVFDLIIARRDWTIPPTAVMPAEAGIQYAAASPSTITVSEYWITRLRGL